MEIVHGRSDRLKSNTIAVIVHNHHCKLGEELIRTVHGIGHYRVRRSLLLVKGGRPRDAEAGQAQIRSFQPSSQFKQGLWHESI